MVHSGGVFWTWTFTEAQLTRNVFIGFAICFPSAFFVVLLATRNITLTVLSIVSVMAIVASVMGFCKWAMDWGLGIAESIAAVIVIGFSVDYVVHLAHMYVDAGHQSPPINGRNGRVAYALKSMGVTVISGAVTTFGSGFFLVLTQLIFFVKFSKLIMVTITSSLVVALCFFMPMLVLIGPEGTSGNLPCGEQHKDESDGFDKTKQGHSQQDGQYEANRPEPPQRVDQGNTLSFPHSTTQSNTQSTTQSTTQSGQGATGPQLVVDSSQPWSQLGDHTTTWEPASHASDAPNPRVAAAQGTSASYTPRPDTSSRPNQSPSTSTSWKSPETLASISASAGTGRTLSLSSATIDPATRDAYAKSLEKSREAFRRYQLYGLYGKTGIYHCTFP